MAIQRFEDLVIWRVSLHLTKHVYDFTRKPAFSRDFGLVDQLRRAIVSVSSNIVEGFEKNNINEFARYLRIAKGSVGEVRNQLYIAYAAGYISQEEQNTLDTKLSELGRQIGAFIVYLQKVQKSRKK